MLRRDDGLPGASPRRGGTPGGARPPRPRPGGATGDPAADPVPPPPPAQRFVNGLGMRLVGKSDLSTGNQTYASYALRSGDLVMAFTAPYGLKSPK